MSRSLAAVASESDAAVHRARADLVRAVRDASASGLTQAEIARQIGRSQPEVSRLLRFHGRTPLGRRLRAHRTAVLGLISKAGGGNVRVFGSVAREEDGDLSDVDLLFTMGPALSLMELGNLEDHIGRTLGARVDLLPDTAVRPLVRERILREAVPL